MKILKTNILLVLLLISTIIFNSCNTEEIDSEILSTNVTPEINNEGNSGNTNTNNPIGNEGEITLYTIVGDNIVKKQDYKVTGQDLIYQQNTAKHQELWQLTKKIIPANYRTKMSEFLIYNGDVSGSAGFVFETKPDLSKWQMGIAINFADDQSELVYTIIHEFGHILTLNNDQVDASIDNSSCKNYYTGEGCAKATSYIHKLQNNHWADIWEEFNKAKETETEMEAFYKKYESRFVTQYASTNPGEDIAEVFATFVTRNSGVNGNSIAEQKIQLMYNHSELIDLRNYIRSNLGATSTSRSSKGEKSLLPAPGSWKQANTFGNPNKSHCLHKK